MAEPLYIIGIDLGTTNSVVAYTETASNADPPDIRVFEIPQLVDAGAVEHRPVLPSFVLLPEAYDVTEGALGLPWDASNDKAVGVYARNRGAEIPHRLISSAKSWLCNPMVDRKAPILPWKGAENPAPEGRKLSPVEASAAILIHIRDAWNHVMARSGAGLDPGLRMESQEILLTVPASFDAVARELTVAAAEMAGLTHVTLLEEPQAAFYSWIAFSGDRWRKAVNPGERVLVCDVGGGTSDFSLIRIGDEDGDLSLERIAVGNHLLVGGDNMDLALAYALAQDLAKKGKRLDSWQMNGLRYSCREAKERLLADPTLERQPVTLLGRGSSLIGGAITVDLRREQIESILRDGFFPRCAPEDRPADAKRAGIREFGLAYESDPAVTRHLSAFLNRRDEDGSPRSPAAVLFNGGVMKAAMLRKRILDILGEWAGPDTQESIRELEASDFDLSVARGAAYYGLARKGRGIRIRGGLGRSYYIGVAASMPAVPGIPSPTKALCVAPFGMEEGTTADISGREFVLTVGEPAAFEFLGSTTRQSDAVGTVVEDWEGEIEPVAALETTLEGEKGDAIPVTLELKVTEIGTLELWCVSSIDGRRWKLEFNVRES
ncbi:MAG: Hsp70 family protein [Desulfobacterales bacterium]